MAPAIPRSVISLDPNVGSLVAAPHAKLLQDVGNVGLNGVHGDHHPCGNVSVCHAIGNEPEDVPFAPGKSADVRSHGQRSRHDSGCIGHTLSI